MPLSPITEFFNGGVVTARHPVLLQSGELQRADNCVYRDKDPSIQRAPGRTAYNATTLKTTPTGSTVAGVKGLVQLTFDQNTDQILAWTTGDGTNSYFWTSPFTGTTGTFNVITGGGQIVANSHSNTTIDGAPAGSFTFMLVGARIVGSNIPAGTYVSAVNSDTSITITANATSTASGITYTFDVGIPNNVQDQPTDTLDVIQWGNSYFLLTKNGTTQRLFWKSFPGTSTTETLVMRAAGLLPITQFDSTNLSVQAGAGWSSVLGNGYYWFLLTEILSTDDPSLPDVEAGYTANDGRAQVVQITSYATQFIRFTFPAITNDGSNDKNRATHWGIYMSFSAPNIAAYSDPTSMPSPATFKRILKVNIENTTQDIKFDNVSQGGLFPTTSAAFGGLTQFVNPSGAFAPGGSWAHAFSGSGQTAANAWAGFGFSSGTPWSGYGVTGIQVFLSVSADPTAGTKAGYYVWLDNNGTKSSVKNFGIAAGPIFLPQAWGGQFDTWGQAWTPADISNLRVIVQKTYSNSVQNLQIDSIKVVVYYSGASLTSGAINVDGPPYQVVTYRSQVGTTISDPANYIIPASTTGDIFQGSLVVNDVANPSTLRYSIAGAPESFPKPYFIQFNSKRKDIITLIRRLGQILIVGMRDSIKRVNYLPTESDVDFHQGEASEDIIGDQGIVGPRAATTFDLTGVGVVLAYVSYNGVYYTDGITSRPLNLDLKWSTLVKQSALGTSILRVYPKEKWILFHYCPFGAVHNKNTAVMIFSYSQEKIKESGFLPAIGPITISGYSANHANLAGIPYYVTGHQVDGHVYVEDNGDTQAAGYQVSDLTDTLVAAPITPIIITRRMILSGYSRDGRIQRIYMLHDPTGTSVSVTSTTTLNSTAVTSAAGFGSITKGMLVRGQGIKPGTIVVTVTDSSNIVISQAALSTGTNSLTFDNGTLATTMYGGEIAQTMFKLQTLYTSTLTGDILSQGHDNAKIELEFRIEKVVMPDTSYVDLGQPMRLQNLTFLAEDQGTEQNRST